MKPTLFWVQSTLNCVIPTVVKRIPADMESLAIPPGGGSFVFFNDNFTGGVGLNPNNNEIAGAGLVINAGSAA